MKRILAISLALLASAALFFGAFFIRPDSGNSDGKYKLGMGTAVTLKTDEKGGAVVTTVAVITDADGKIVDCVVDCGDYEISFDDVKAGGKGDAYQTKNELGDSYNMVAYSGGMAKAEWYEQAEYFEKYVVGKNANEATLLDLNGGKPGDADLLAGCTIDVTDFKAALVKAMGDTLAVEFESEKAPILSLALINSDSVEELKEGAYPVALTTDIAAVATVDGKVLAAACDVAETELGYTEAGELTEVKYGGTKREKLDSYGMKAYAGATYEWYEQSQNFCKFIKGMTASEIAAIPMGEDGKAADADLLAGCTVYVGNFVRIAEKAAKAAK